MRNSEDTLAGEGLGIGATRYDERMLAVKGLLEKNSDKIHSQ